MLLRMLPRLGCLVLSVEWGVRRPTKLSIFLRFLAVSSATLSCSCRHTVPGLSPSAHTGDGTTDLIIVRSSFFVNAFILDYFQVHNTYHLNYLHYLFRTAFNMSHPFRLPFVQAVRVKSWSFTPQANKQTEDHIGPHSFHLTG